MQASLEAESRGKAEAMRAKKKLEQDINELEIAVDVANKDKSDVEKTIKKLQSQIKEMQSQVIKLHKCSFNFVFRKNKQYLSCHQFEEEQRARLEAREQFNIAERRALSMAGGDHGFK